MAGVCSSDEARPRLRCFSHPHSDHKSIDTQTLRNFLKTSGWLSMRILRNFRSIFNSFLPNARELKTKTVAGRGEVRARIRRRQPIDWTRGCVVTSSLEANRFIARMTLWYSARAIRTLCSRDKLECHLSHICTKNYKLEEKIQSENTRVYDDGVIYGAKFLLDR